ncbi:unnamed protein product, partial [Gulo gulo]
FCYTESSKWIIPTPLRFSGLKSIRYSQEAPIPISRIYPLLPLNESEGMFNYFLKFQCYLQDGHIFQLALEAHSLLALLLQFCPELIHLPKEGIMGCTQDSLILGQKESCSGNGHITQQKWSQDTSNSSIP